MDLNPQILDMLYSPFSWVIYEILSAFLFIVVISDAIKRNEEDNKLIRVFEIIGYVVYAVIFENIGVLSQTYNYSFHRFMMFGVVPLSIPLFEASIFYSSLLFSERFEFPKWTRPFVVAFIGMLVDFSLDPVSIADTQKFGNVIESRWMWEYHYNNTFFGIPYFNFTGWFVLMFYYTSLIIIGRSFYEKFENKFNYGIIYIIISIIIGDILILSPITLFIMYAWPFAQPFENRTAEIIMLLIIIIITISTLIFARIRQKYNKSIEQSIVDNIKYNLKNNKTMWFVPLSIHILNLLITIVLGLSSVYIPVLLFGLINFIYIGYYFSLGKIS